MGELVISFTPEGSVQSLHMDNFDLGFLGDKKIERASDIHFDEDIQLWNIRLIEDGNIVDAPFLDGFTQYEDARKAEVYWLNFCRRYSVHPLSDLPIAIMRLYRDHHGH